MICAIFANTPTKRHLCSIYMRGLLHCGRCSFPLNTYREDKTVQKLNTTGQQNIDKIKITVHIPESVSDVIRQSKINKIYDILSPKKVK